MYFVCVYNLVSHYDLDVLSMSVMGFQKKSGWRELYPHLFGNAFNYAKPLRASRRGK